MEPVEILKEQELVAKVEKGHHAGMVAEHVAAYANTERRKIENTIFLKFDQGLLISPAEAVQAWMQLHTLHNLERSLSKKERDGVQAAKRLTRDHAPDGSGDPEPKKTRRRFVNA